MIELFKLIGELIQVIRDELNNGVSEEEIAERLMQPGAVGRKIIQRVRSDSDKISDYIKNG